MRKIFLYLTATLIISLALTACTPNSTPHLPQATDSDIASGLGVPSAVLGETKDAGDEYINSFVFFGESTTYHLKNRGVLKGGTATTQVWGAKSGTMMLDIHTANARIVYPESGEEVDLAVAAARKKPQYMLLCFGLNGAAANVKRGSEYFKDCYRKLINTIRSASPDTHIILQSCFPVAKDMDMTAYTTTASELCAHIRTLNSWTLELAEEMSLAYLDTANILCDSDGFLQSRYDEGDGYHLTREAYIEILKYIRTHAYER